MDSHTAWERELDRRARIYEDIEAGDRIEAGRGAGRPGELADPAHLQQAQGEAIDGKAALHGLRLPVELGDGLCQQAELALEVVRRERGDPPPLLAQELALQQAAEIVVVGALEGLEKIIRLLETFYDLLTGLDKVGHLTDLPAEHCKGRELPCNPEGASVVCRNVRFAYEGRGEILSNLNLSIEPGQHVSLVGKSGVGKSTLAMLFCGLHEANHGLVQINGMDVRDAHPESLRRSVGLVSDANEVFAGTIEENILLGREDITHEDLQWAIEFAQLTDDLAVLPEGLQTRLVSEGRNLSRGQVQRLLIARAVVSRPQLLILDEGFTGVDENDKLMILEELFNRRHNWTIIDISHDPEVVVRSSKVHVLADGQIAESGRPSELMRVREGSFTKLFPTLGLREVK